MKLRFGDRLIKPIWAEFSRIQILKIHNIYELKVSKFIYRCVISKDTPVNFHHWFIPTIHVHHHITRSKFKYINSDNLINTNNLFIPGTRTSHYGLKQIKSQGPKIWNIIPPMIWFDASYAKFSNDLKKFFIAKIDN